MMRQGYTTAMRQVFCCRQSPAKSSLTSLTNIYTRLEHHQSARSHKSRAAVDYTPISVEPHGHTRGAWPIATVANDSQLHLIASSI